jgi:hypothetical protein
VRELIKNDPSDNHVVEVKLADTNIDKSFDQFTIDALVDMKNLCINRYVYDENMKVLGIIFDSFINDKNELIAKVYLDNTPDMDCKRSYLSSSISAAVQRNKFDNSTIDRVLSLYEVVILDDENKK